MRRVQANLKRYRAAVLKAACEGKLVPTEAELARQEGRTYETGAQLLERILTERRKKWNWKGKIQGTSQAGYSKSASAARGVGVGDYGAIISLARTNGLISPRNILTSRLSDLRIDDFRSWVRDVVDSIW